MWWVYHYSQGSHCLQPPRGFSKDKQAFTPLSQFLPWDLPQKLMKKGIDSTHKRLHKAQWLWLVPEWAAQDGAGCFGQTAWGPSHQDAAGLSVHIAHPSDPTLAPHEGAEASEGSSPLCRISDQPAVAVCVVGHQLLQLKGSTLALVITTFKLERLMPDSCIPIPDLLKKAQVGIMQWNGCKELVKQQLASLFSSSCMDTLWLTCWRLCLTPGPFTA